MAKVELDKKAREYILKYVPKDEADFVLGMIDLDLRNAVISGKQEVIDSYKKIADRVLYHTDGMVKQ